MSGTIQENADTLEAMRDSLVEAGSFTASLWMSYLLVFFYLLIAIAGVTQRDLFLENPVQLPFLDVAVPLQGFFFLGPGIFLIIHMYVLLHFSMLASKIGSFNRKLRETTEEPLRSIIRRELPNNVFVHFLAGPRELRGGLFGFLLRSISWVSLVFGPVFLLLFFQLQFLCFHSESITAIQRLFVTIDFLLLWRLWPDALHGEVTGERKGARSARDQSGAQTGESMWRNLGKPVTYAYMAALTLFAAFIVFTVATFPGELLHADYDFPPIKWARAQLVDGQLDPASGTLSSYWTDKIVLPNFDPIDHSKFSSEAQFDDVQSTYALRGRNLSGAIFTNDDFKKFDFTGSDLTGAQFDDADLREAQFGCTKNESILLYLFVDNPGGQKTAGGTVGTQNARYGSNPLQVPKKCTILSGASFSKAKLQGADFSGAYLEHTSFELAFLQAAVFDGAHLNNAVLYEAGLQDASFFNAHLESAMLFEAHLQGANFDFANLDGANLDGAQLQGASLNSTQLNGAQLYGAQLQDASLRQTHFENAELAGAILNDAAFDNTHLEGAILANAQLVDATLSDMDLTGVSLTLIDFSGAWFENVKPAAIQARLERRFMGMPVSPQEYQTQTLKMWEQIGCQGDGAPYIIRSFMQQTPVSFSADPADLSALAGAFSQKSCEGNRGLSDLEQAELEALKAVNKTN